MAKSASSGSKFKYAELLRKQNAFIEGETNKIDYDDKELIDLAQDARILLMKEPTLLELTAPLVVVGDIHGQFADLQRIFRLLGSKPGGTVGKRKFLFLGDYVDRGPQSIECIFALLVYKVRYPKLFYLLRGNHETLPINKCYGFYGELTGRWGQEKGHALWIAINAVFVWLPLAAVVNKRILCMHGGIGPSLNSLDDIRNLKRPITDPNANPLACDLLWADPMIDLRGYIPNTVRGVSVYFGEDTVIEACARLKLDLIVRAHQMMLNGYGFYCNRRLVTVFSAPRYYVDKNNKGAVMTIGRNLKIGFLVLAPVTGDIEGKDRFEEGFTRTADDSSYTNRNCTDPNASTVVERQPASAETGQAPSATGTQSDTKPTQ
ncbi:Ser/Thr protein phosphatase family protein [Aphelenchoides avenae]|nr:Ser/Thr protein phosphatase family protein [Aphelenchus avenae]